MNANPLDDLDRQILHELQLDARRNRDADIATKTGVTGTTIGNRIQRLEELGVIKGFHPSIDYEAAGHPLVVLFICTIPAAQRAAVIDFVLDVRGVINVRETTASEQNVHVLVVADATSAIQRTTNELEELGLRIVRSDLMSRETAQPWNHFYRDDAEAAEQ